MVAKHRHTWNQGVYERYIHEGRGCGNGPGYTPWIRVQDFASRGTISRVKGRKSGRVHHLMSNNELAYFYILDWSDNVLDIREQYPLMTVESVMRIAERAGVRYPRDNVSGYPYVMTCDFLVTTTNGLKARTVKMTSELSNARVLEKLEIERRYWAGRGIDWKIVTENEIPYHKARNIEWLYATQYFDSVTGIPGYAAGALDMIKTWYEESGLSILEIAQAAEGEFMLKSGVGLSLFKQLVLNKTIHMDLDGKIDLSKGRTIPIK